MVDDRQGKKVNFSVQCSHVVVDPNVRLHGARVGAVSVMVYGVDLGELVRALPLEETLEALHAVRLEVPAETASGGAS